MRARVLVVAIGGGALLAVSGCGSRLDCSPELARLATVTLEVEDDAIKCVIEPHADLPRDQYIVCDCYKSGNRMIWHAAREVGELLDKSIDPKRLVITVVGEHTAVKAGDVSRVKVMLSESPFED